MRQKKNERRDGLAEVGKTTVIVNGGVVSVEIPAVGVLYNGSVAHVMLPDGYLKGVDGEDRDVEACVIPLVMFEKLLNEGARWTPKRWDVYSLLRGYPSGTPLYSPVVGEVELQGLSGVGEVIVSIKKRNQVVFFGRHGEYEHDGIMGECLLFPSKSKRDWDDWELKLPLRGDLKRGEKVVYMDGHRWVIGNYERNGKVDGEKRSHVIPFSMFDVADPEKWNGGENDYGVCNDI